MANSSCIGISIEDAAVTWANDQLINHDKSFQLTPITSFKSYSLDIS